MFEHQRKLKINSLSIKIKYESFQRRKTVKRCNTVVCVPANLITKLFEIIINSASYVVGVRINLVEEYVVQKKKKTFLVSKRRRLVEAIKNKILGRNRFLPPRNSHLVVRLVKNSIMLARLRLLFTTLRYYYDYYY